MFKRKDAAKRPWQRAKPLSITDRIAEFPSVIFWMICFLPLGVLMALVFNSIAPLVMSVCFGYLANESMDQ